VPSKEAVASINGFVGLLERGPVGLLFSIKTII
jgi:hypothetical protein